MFHWDPLLTYALALVLTLLCPKVVPLDKRIREEEVKSAFLARAMGNSLAFDDYKFGDKLSEQFFLFALPSEKFLYRHKGKGKGHGKGKGMPRMHRAKVLAPSL